MQQTRLSDLRGEGEIVDPEGVRDFRQGVQVAFNFGWEFDGLKVRVRSTLVAWTQRYMPSSMITQKLNL